MKKLLCLILMCVWLNSFATHYYVATSGNDAATGLVGAPWRTISKVNSFTFAAGDIISFNGGDVFYGRLNITRSGSAGNPITYNSYGTGTATITGFTTVSAWSNLGTNIWESTSAVSTLPYTNIVSIGGNNIAMGRTPNSGFYTYQSHSGSPATSLTSSNLNASAINYTGAEVAFNITTYIVGRNPITAHSGTTITITPGAAEVGVQSDGASFIIQNDARTLDVQNEWYYNPSTKKLIIYSTASPTNVQLATVDTLVWNNGFDYITFDNIAFTGSGKYTILLSSGATNNTITNSSFDFNGRDAIFINGTGANTNTRIEGNSFNHTNNNSINAWYPGTTGTIIRNNTITNSGLFYGMGGGFVFTGIGGTWQSGITSRGASGTIELNTVTNSGYNGIEWYGTNTLVKNNYVKDFCLTNTDGGGIYTVEASASTHGQVGANITGNIVENCVPDEGIYCDDNSNGFQIEGNTVSNCNINYYIHNSYNLHIYNNTSYNSPKNRNPGGFLLWMFNPSGTVTPSNFRIHNNIFFGKAATDIVLHDPIERILPALTIDTNYYARPISGTTGALTIVTYDRTGGGFVSTNRNLAMWQTYSGKDLNSFVAPMAITNVNQLFFCYNPTDHDSTITLPGNYIDVKNVAYPGTITLSAFTSAVLISTGGNLPPVANAGADKNITLPTTSLTQNGSGTDADGTVVSYQWSQISGPASATFGSATSATTSINAMSVAGTYVFQLLVRDNQGAIGTDQMIVIVNAAPPVNIPPTANAGGNKNITLPTNSVTQVGSGTDPDGTITAYAWTKTSGPATYTIVSPTSATTVINNLIAGTYVFTLTVTDDDGATGSSTATIIVNITPNLPPTANAGTDQSLTWPTNSTTVSASGSSDPDGSIVAYNWSKISGPASYGITNAGSSTATITGLTPGAYQFQLQVTDNSGATATDIVGITESQGSATISQTGLSKVFNTFPQGITVTTSPPGISTSTTYNGVTSQPTNVGSYTVVTGGTDPNWIMTPVTNTFTITKATTVINATGATVNFDNLPHSITGTTTPSVTGLSATYTGISGTVYPTSATPPTAIGIYRVDFIVTNSNYQATPISVNLTIVNNPAPIFISDSVFNYDGFAHNVTVTSLYSYSLVGSPRTLAGSNQVIATINDGIHTGADTANITINKATGTFSWTQPAPIPFGAQLTAGILNATSNIPGTFTYSHIIGEIPPIGPLTIVATFHPTDSNNFNGGTVTRTIYVYAVNPFLNYFITGVDGRIFFIEQ